MKFKEQWKEKDYWVLQIQEFKGFLLSLWSIVL